MVGVVLPCVAFACGSFSVLNATACNPWIGIIVPMTISVSLVPLTFMCLEAHDFFARDSAKAVYQYFLVLKDQKKQQIK
jgi:hypothetical protein